MYRFGNMPSQISPLLTAGGLNVQPGQRVNNDIRSTYEKHLQQMSRFGGGYDSDDTDSDSDSDTEELHFGEEMMYNDRELHFGKKSAGSRAHQARAKKAMRLAWSEGISLGDAWAIVKGEKKLSAARKRKPTSKRKSTAKKTTTKRKSTTKKTTTKRKSTTKKTGGRSQAAKAMKIAHREGISLKKAWAKVKKA